MHVELSTDQRQAINTAGTPLEVVDSLTGNVYVLLPQESFARVQSLVSEELAETLPAQIETAMAPVGTIRRWTNTTTTINIAAHELRSGRHRAC